MSRKNIYTGHSTQIEGLDHFLFLEGFDNFLGVYVSYKVNMHQKNLNSARIFQEIISFARICLYSHLILQT